MFFAHRTVATIPQLIRIEWTSKRTPDKAVERASEGARTDLVAENWAASTVFEENNRKVLSVRLHSIFPVF